MIIKRLTSYHGDVFFNALTGEVTAIDVYIAGEGLPNITKVDVKEWKRCYGYPVEKYTGDALDILDTGYWHKTFDGETVYEPPVRFMDEGGIAQ